MEVGEACEKFDEKFYDLLSTTHHIIGWNSR